MTPREQYEEYLKWKDISGTTRFFIKQSDASLECGYANGKLVFGILYFDGKEVDITKSLLEERS